MSLLRREFPDLESFELPAYNIRYTFDSMMANMIIQGPGSLITIKKENRAADKLARSWKADVLISDNRFGFLSEITENIYITHQLNIPANNRMIANMASRVHQRIISKFDQCWVPDYRGARNLAGKLSQVNIKIPTTYLGPQSRMVKEDVDKEYDFTAVLSGPEPQRTKLEKVLFNIFSKDNQQRFCIVRGTNSSRDLKGDKPNIQVFDLLTTDDLNRLMNRSSFVICRSGYTSIMDLVKLGKPALLIPTPGQYEQEYLAERLNGRYGFSTCKQGELADKLKVLFTEG